MNISTNGLTAAIRAGLSELDSKATARRLYEDDSLDYAGLFRKVMCASKGTNAHTVTLVAHGGFVSGSYGRTAYSDRLCITATDAGWNVSATRSYAQRRPRGDGYTIIGRIIKPGQSNGAIVLRA